MFSTRISLVSLSCIYIPCKAKAWTNPEADGGQTPSQQQQQRGGSSPAGSQQKLQDGGQTPSQQQQAADGGQTPSQQQQQQEDKDVSRAMSKAMPSKNQTRSERREESFPPLPSQKKQCVEQSAGRESRSGAIWPVPKPMPRAAAPLTTVRLWTWGRHTLYKISPYCNYTPVKELYRISQLRTDVNLGVSKKALRAAIRLREEDADPLILDCKRFHEDQSYLRTCPSWGHGGLHPDNVRRLFAHNNGDTMHNLLQELHGFVQERQRDWAATNAQRRTLDIGLQCNQGRDRSVGMSVVLENMFNLNGWTATTTHLCRSHWRRNHNCQKEADQHASPMDPFRYCPSCKPVNSRRLVQAKMEQMPSMHLPVRL